MVYVTRSPGDVANRAYIGLKISREMMIYHSLSSPPASWPSSPGDTYIRQVLHSIWGGRGGYTAHRSPTLS